MMSLHDIFHVTVYELKQQSRTWVFRLFAFLSLIGIVLCHVYWQGQGNCYNWKMVALPCSMPLVNAYLFSLIQSLFLVVIMADVPQRISRQGALESIFTRPTDNASFYQGIIAGNFLLFMLMNVLVILASVFVVNLTSLAPVSWKYYLFYMLTLNIPSWIFISGLSLWISSVSGSRFLAIVLSVAWLMGAIFWLPYHLHGTLDFLASGIPNLFSEITGHVNLSCYLLHRSVYLLIGAGLLAWSVNRMRRLPNSSRARKIHVLSGMILVLSGLGCGVALECFYLRDRQARAAYRTSFERNWNEATCRVKSHSITLVQSGEMLTIRSELVVYNSGKQSLESIVLFLNPGLRVTRLAAGGNTLHYKRDEQAILIDRDLEVGDSLRLQVEYEGVIDDRFCDLQLTDKDYENTFHEDSFFPTGRRGAFVRENLLLLPSACVWYPVAIPPVNPLMPAGTGRDFTRFRLSVKHPLQRTVVSQGVPVKTKDAIHFTCSNALHGISLYGGDCKRYTLPMYKHLNLQFCSSVWGKMLERNFSKISRATFINLWKNPPLMYWNDCKTCMRKSWYEPKVGSLNLLEVPVSYVLDSHEGKPEAGLVEPGMIFFRERGFDMDVAREMAVGRIANQDDFISVCSALYTGFFDIDRKSNHSHPLLGLGRRDSEESHDNDNRGSSLWKYRDIWVHSLKYPFMGKVFESLQSAMWTFGMDQGLTYASDFARVMPYYDYLSGHTLQDMLSVGEERVRRAAFSMKIHDLWTWLTLKIPQQELRKSLDSLSRYYRGEVDFDSLVQAWSARWDVNVNSVITAWMQTKHEQFFKIRNAEVCYNPETRQYRLDGKIMNAGKTGGIVSIEYGSFVQLWRSRCYLAPGEAKVFRLVANNHILNMNMGLSANRPVSFLFDYRTERKEETWEAGDAWETISIAEFMKDENKNEFIVDDQDVGFELVDGNLTWIQRWFQKAPPVRNLIGREANRWEPVITSKGFGDSIRGYHCISGGSGKSTATWRVHLPEAGRYRVMGKVYKESFSSGIEKPGGIVYYYTVSGGNTREDVEVNLDASLSGRMNISGWVLLGEYDFPMGEASVTLSDKEIRGRKDVAIIADAVKWVKQDP